MRGKPFAIGHNSSYELCNEQERVYRPRPRKNMSEGRGKVGKLPVDCRLHSPVHSASHKENMARRGNVLTCCRLNWYRFLAALHPLQRSKQKI